MNSYAEREAETKSLRIAIRREMESREEKSSAEFKERNYSFRSRYESKKASEAPRAGGAGVPSWRGHTAWG